MPVSRLQADFDALFGGDCFGGPNQLSFHFIFKGVLMLLSFSLRQFCAVAVIGLFHGTTFGQVIDITSTFAGESIQSTNIYPESTASLRGTDTSLEVINWATAVDRDISITLTAGVGKRFRWEITLASDEYELPSGRIEVFVGQGGGGGPGRVKEFGTWEFLNPEGETPTAPSEPTGILFEAQIKDFGKNTEHGNQSPLYETPHGSYLTVHTGTFTGLKFTGTVPPEFTSITSGTDGLVSRIYVISEATFNDVGDVIAASLWVEDDPNASANDPPVASAGTDQSIRVGNTVVLDGSESFDGNTSEDLLDYAWSFVTMPGGSSATLDDAASIMPSFVADVAGTYTLELIVTDEQGLSSDPAYVAISSDNLAPTAVVAADLTLVITGDVVQFDGSGSSDPEEDALTYSWTIVSSPLGSAASLVDGNTVNPMLTPDVEGAYVISLEVSDFLGAGAPVEFEIVATTPVEFAEILIIDVSDIVAALGAGEVTTSGNQNAFGNFLANAMKDIQKGKIDKAIDTLNEAIERTDGCALRGSPDGNGKGRDWVTDCDAQLAIYDLLTQAVDALEY